MDQGYKFLLSQTTEDLFYISNVLSYTTKNP